MLDIEELQKTKLGPYIKKALKYRAPDPAFHAMHGHNPDLSEAMYTAWGTVFNSGVVDHKLKEIIRVQLSRHVTCNYWGNVRSASAKQQGLTEEGIDDGIDNYENSTRLSDAEKAALRYSDFMSASPEKIDEAFYNDLKKHFSLEEIVELGAYIGINIGFHTFFRTLDFYPMFAPDGRLVSQEESKEIYGTAPVSHTKGAMDRALERAPSEAAE